MKTLGLLVCLGAVALAQSNVTRYYGDECAVMSKDVYVSPNGLTFLEFYDSIDAGGVISPGLMIQSAEAPDATQSLQEVVTPFVAAKAEGSNRLDLSTELSAAETPLTVWVKGQPCLLRLTVKPDLVGPQRYIIERSRPLPALTRVSPPGAAFSRDASEASSENTATPTTPPEAITVSAPDLASNLDFELVSVTPVSGHAANAFFTFTNHSDRVVVLDGVQVGFVQDGVQLPTKVRKEPLRGLVQPSETHVGYIVLEGAAPGAGILTWTLQEMGGETRRVVVREALAVPAR